MRRLQIGLVENCAGAGQVSAAAAELGVEVLRLVEHDPTCQWLLTQRHGARRRARSHMATGLGTSEKHKLVLVFGGYPCQGHSSANRERRGADDPRSRLLLEALKVLSDSEINYNQRGRLLVFAGENVVDKEELAAGPGSLLVQERAYAQKHGYGRSSMRGIPSTVDEMAPKLSASTCLQPSRKGGRLLLQFSKILIKLALEQKHTTFVCFCQKESGPRVVKSGHGPDRSLARARARPPMRAVP